MQLFLIRHPRPSIEEGICYGRLDVDCKDARPVAERLRAHLPNASRLISSPLLRARRLAELLHPTPLFDARLMEIDFGEWEGRRWSEIDRAAIDAWAADVRHYAPPGGESAAMLQARAVDCVSDLLINRGVAEKCRGGLTLITHSGVLRALLGHWLQLPVGEWSTLKLDFGSVTRIDVEAGNTTLRYLNR